jgi:GNAT superfamily N-acetyltransferase
LEVRDATAEDAAALAGLLEVLGYPSTPGQVVGRLARLRADAGSHVLVAASGCDVVGMAAFHIRPALTRDEPMCRIVALVVDPLWPRRGVATALAGAVEAAATRAGCSHVEVTTGDHRPEAHAFYQRLGFARSSQRFRKTLRP